ncbi:hypothetical protein D1094_09360 [Colwellia sp. RSH04]|nr:hypothetical protein D1094_09360 [Colwellia sp. RSH04]
MSSALQWENKGYRIGMSEQCMNWTREVLMAACGSKFNALQTQNPWDKELLGINDKLLPEHADSLASNEFGINISRVDETIAGDLIFLKNTYGNWQPGVITHVGIATGNNRYIHRMTSNKGIVKIQEIPLNDFSGAIRLDKKFCQ